MATYKHIASLIVKYRNNELTDKERKELEDWCALSEKNQMLFERLNDESYMSIKRRRMDSIDIEAQWKEITARLPVKPKAAWRVLLSGWRLAAVIVLLLGAGATWFLVQQGELPKKQHLVQQVEEPKGFVDSSRIALTLAGGQVVYPEGKNDGQVAKQSNAVIYKEGEGLLYKYANGEPDAGTAFNTLSMPKGKSYKLQLPDGSKVWVNAASSITYPTAFTGTERRVAITGEVYFEIAHQQMKSASGAVNTVPFIVEISPAGSDTNTRIEVLGTHFNVNAYKDAPYVSTTLLEGKVKLSGSGKSTVLKPGEEGQLGAKGGLKKVKPSAATTAVAWTNDEFDYYEEDIQSIMRALARWYNCEIIYRDEVHKHYKFNISRKATLREVLDVLELLGDLRFTILGKQVIVTTVQG